MKEKPKIKWPKSTEEVKYKRFDEEVDNLLQRQKATVEERQQKLTKVIYDKGLNWLGLENVNPPSARNKKEGPSMRQAGIRKIKEDKK